MADMTPTEKDAMALAVIERLVRAAHLAYAMPPTDDEVTALREHIAHLASRIAELEAERDEANERAARTAAQYQHEFEAHGQTIERAERAEAELAAAKVDAERGREISVAFLPVMEAMRPLVLNLERLKDAARGGE